MTRKAKKSVSRKRYSKEFKTEAVHLVIDGGEPKSRIATDLGVSLTALSRWVKEFEARGGAAFPGNGVLPELERQLATLQKENQLLRQERDILKKATAFFAKENR